MDFSVRKAKIMLYAVPLIAFLLLNRLFNNSVCYTIRYIACLMILYTKYSYSVLH